MKIFSQNNEQDIIVNYFKGFTGKFLDLGAYDGVTFSNTYALALSGWRGVAVEGSPSVFIDLKKNVKGLPIELCQVVITHSKEDLVTWHDNNQATATYVEANVVKWQRETPFSTMTIMTCKVDRLIELYGTAFDFVNIDIEGGSVDIFKTLIKLMPSVKLWCVEHDNRINEIKNALPKAKILLYNAENVILATN
jgi:FkbM family methyltransferase